MPQSSSTGTPLASSPERRPPRPSTFSTLLGSTGTFPPVEGATRHVHSHLRAGTTLVLRDGCTRGGGQAPRDPRRRIHGARRPVRIREVHYGEDARRAGGRQMNTLPLSRGTFLR